MKRRHAGFALPELMVVLAVGGSLCAVVTTASIGIRQEQRHADGHARDLAALSKAAGLVEDDLRTGVFSSAGWTFRSQTLRRGEQVVAQGVSECFVRQDGDVWRVSIGLTPQNTDPGARGPMHVEFVVRARAKDRP